MSIKLWMDDVRPAPEGWIWAKTATETINLLLSGTVEYLSLDHDLGDECKKCLKYDEEEGLFFGRICDSNCKHECHRDGSWVARWMAEENIWPLNKPTVHSANPVGREYMLGVIDRYGPYIK